MLRLLFDENFNHRILRGVRAQLPDADLLTVQEAGLSGAPDPELLAWASWQDRILATHDVQTMLGFAYERIAAQEEMPGVFAVPKPLLSDKP
jgi:predicted nuclease of predicted toxin-antitoxin system